MASSMLTVKHNDLRGTELAKSSVDVLIIPTPLFGYPVQFWNDAKPITTIAM